MRRDHLKDFDPSTIETVLRSFYVDDLLKSTEDTEHGQQLIKEIIEIIKLGGYRLTKFVSNDPELLKNVPEDLISPSVNIRMDDGQCHSTKALGIIWNTKDDVWTFLPNINKKRNPKCC